MKKGDILFIKYKYDPLGWVIRKTTHSEWNHCAFVFDDTRIIESKAKGIIITQLNKYLKHPHLYKVKIMRISSLGDLRIRVITSYMMKKVGQGYSYISFLATLFSLFFKPKRKIFRFTCSGFIAQALSQVDYYIYKSKDPMKLSPEDIYKKLKKDS